EAKRQRADRLAEFRAIRAIPGDDFIEGGQLGRWRPGDTGQVEPGRLDSADAVSKADERDVTPGGPNFQIAGIQALERGERDHQVPDGRGADNEPAHSGPSIAKTEAVTGVLFTSLAQAIYL